MPNKYFNKKTSVDGILFDSIKEANKYQELKLMKQDHGPEGVKDFTLQPHFELQPSFKKDEQHYRAINYIADFDVTYNNGKREIIDIKGFKTEVWRIKAKLFDFKFPELTLIIE